MQVRARYKVFGALAIAYIILVTIATISSGEINFWNEAVASGVVAKEQIIYLIYMHWGIFIAAILTWLLIVRYCYLGYFGNIIPIWLCIIIGAGCLMGASEISVNNLLIQYNLKDGDVDHFSVVVLGVLGYIMSFIVPLIILASAVGIKVRLQGRRIIFDDS